MNAHMQAHVRMGGNEKHVKAEASVVELFVNTMLSKGFTVSVFDGEDWACKRSNTPEVIMSNIMSTDQDTLHVEDASGKLIGHADFIYCNSPSEVLADHSVSLEMYLDPVNALLGKLEEQDM